MRALVLRKHRLHAFVQVTRVPEDRDPDGDLLGPMCGRLPGSKTRWIGPGPAGTGPLPQNGRCQFILVAPHEGLRPTSGRRAVRRHHHSSGSATLLFESCVGDPEQIPKDHDIRCAGGSAAANAAFEE